MDRVRTGVIGCGAISGAHLGMAKNFPAVDIVACADLDGDAFTALFASRRDEVTTQLAAFERMRDETVAADRGARLRLATLDNGIAHLRTELAWLDATEGEFA